MRRSSMLRMLALLSASVLTLAGLQCGGGGGSREEQASCPEIVQQAAADWRSAQAAANRACVQDADCSLFDFALDCLPACGSELRGVARSAVMELTAQVRARDGLYCPMLESAQCTFEIPSCGAADIPLHVACLNGRCELCNDTECVIARDE